MWVLLLIIAVVALAVKLNGLRKEVQQLRGKVFVLGEQVSGLLQAQAKDTASPSVAAWPAPQQVRPEHCAAPSVEAGVTSVAAPSADGPAPLTPAVGDAPALPLASASAAPWSQAEHALASVLKLPPEQLDAVLAQRRAQAAAQGKSESATALAATESLAPLEPLGARAADAWPAAAESPRAPAVAANPSRPQAGERFDWNALEDGGAAGASTGGWADTVKNWFSTGNVPVKVGMLVLLAGLAALLRYASVQGWVSLPMWARLAGVAALALGGLAFGWRQRTSKPAFAVALQGGALGALLLTVFAAFKLYGLMGAGWAFGLSAVLVAAVAVMATAQNALTLAVLSVLAGFLAPIWLSTGAGNHVALFSYYALLNAGIFAIAWRRAWRLLNLLGFAFTWGIGVVWGVLQYEPAKFESTQPFLLLFFAFYLALPILYARKAPAQDGDRLDGCLLFGTPLMAFALQSALLEGASWPLAGCAVALAALYSGIAWVLQPKPRYAALARVHWVLAVGFATLALPLAFSARVTGSLFAVEGVALIWLGLQQRRAMPQWAGAALQLAAGLLLLDGVGSWVLQAMWQDLFGNSWLSDLLPRLAQRTPIFNALFMAGLLLTLAAFGSAWLYARARCTAQAGAAYGWGLLCWLLLWGMEIHQHVPATGQVLALVVLAAAMVWLPAEAQRHARLAAPAPALAITSFAALCVAFWLALVQFGSAPPLAAWGALVWPLLLGVALRSVQVFRADQAQWAMRLHAGLLGLVPWVVSLSIAKALSVGLDSGAWAWVALALPWLAMLLMSLWQWPRLRGPLGEVADANRRPAQVVWGAVLGLWWVMGLFHDGRAAPLPWLPVLNPLDAVQLGCLVLLGVWLRQERGMAGELNALPRWRGEPMGAWVAGGLLLITIITARAVHHWGGEAWDAHIWLAPATQAALTVVWSVLGMLCWVRGSRHGQRGLWLLGAGLMGVVLLKLLLIDRQNLGDLLGIGAFIAYGLLCTLVGWLAPAPPKLLQTNGVQAQGDHG